MDQQAGWTLEEALTKVGTGRFQFFALIVCGLANAADAVEILSMALVLPAAEQDLELTQRDKSAMSSCVFLGMLVGGLLWGTLADAVGRKWSLCVALCLNGMFGALSAAATSTGQLVFLRLLAGVGVGGSVPVVFSYLAELLPSSTRGRFMVALAAHWMVGSLYSASMGWAIIPRVGWRPFLLVAALPACIGAMATAGFMPESPRYLLVAKRTTDAEQVLLKMARWNGRSLGHGFCLHGLTSAGPAYSADCSGAMTSSAKTPWKEHAAEAIVQSCRNARKLFQPPLSACLWPLLIAWFGLCGGWYSTVLFIPEYFKQRGAQSGSLYAETFAVAAANLPGNIVSIYMVDWLGRRKTACYCLAGACLAALAFAAAPATGVWAVIAACVFNGISVGGWNSLDLITTELFPTEVRSTGVGLLGAGGRLASFTTTFMAGWLLGLKLWLPMVLAAVLLAAGSAAIMLLPEPAGQPLQDYMDEDMDVHAIGMGATHAAEESTSFWAPVATAVRGHQQQQHELVPTQDNEAGPTEVIDRQHINQFGANSISLRHVTVSRDGPPCVTQHTCSSDSVVGEDHKPHSESEALLGSKTRAPVCADGHEW